MFKVSKENRRNKDETTENEGSLQPLERNNNDKRDGANWSYDPLVIIHLSSSNTTETNSTNSQKKKVNFQGVSKYSLVNVDAIGLRRSSGIADGKKKQLDQSLNHTGFVNVNTVSEENDDLMKEIYLYKEVISSGYKKEFIDAIMNEIENHTKRNH